MSKQSSYNLSTSQESRVVGRHDSAAGAPGQPREMIHPRTKVVVVASSQLPHSAVPATTSAHGGSQSAVPATKSAPRGAQSAAPATSSAHGGSQNAAPATESAHGGSQSAVPAAKSAFQETSENSNHNGGTIPSMIREWPETVSHTSTFRKA